MTVYGNSNAVCLTATAKQVFPADYEAEVSQRLVDAANSNDVKTASECIADPFVDVNFVGTVSLKSKKTEIVLRGESAHQVRVEYDEFKTDVTALFLAAHSGNLELVRKLISAGANVNQKVFRGFATTATVREGHHGRILEALISCGASQPACEEALLEASLLGRAVHAQILMGSDMIRSHVGVHALVFASSRGFADVVHSLIKSGVDANANTRLLLQSSKPSLHSSVNCNALIAAIVGRHINVVKLLLQIGVRTDTKMNLGAWLWDTDTDAGEEFRVGAGLAEPYGVAWCAVEYFEASGAILTLLLQQVSSNVPHFGRTLIHHAILCNNAKAVEVLIGCGADFEATQAGFRAIHLAAQLGSARILENLVNSYRCDVDSLTRIGETAAMICARRKFEEGIRVLASANADFGLVSSRGESICSIADSVGWSVGFQAAILSLIRSGTCVHSSDKTVFSPLIFVTRVNDLDALRKVIETYENIGIDEQDRDGFSAAMVAAAAGNVEAFDLLLRVGANLDLRNKYNETALKLFETSENRDNFEKLMLKCALNSEKSTFSTFFPLHCAAKMGDLKYIHEFLKAKGYQYINSVDEWGNTPLMAAAREGRVEVCELLISLGASCETENFSGETALTLSRNNKETNKRIEQVILDELARGLVQGGSCVAKHTKGGNGSPHGKLLRMIGGGIGVLTWGKSKKRNVVCGEAEVGPSDKFRWNRRLRLDCDVPGLFHVVTTKGKEVHFVCEGGVEMANLWVRGIRLLTRDAILGKNNVI